MSLTRLNIFLKNKNNILKLDIGEVVIEKSIGQGGNGIVYKAIVYDKPIAIKFLVTDSKGDIKKVKKNVF